MVPPGGRVRSVLSWGSPSWPRMGVQPASKSKSGSSSLPPCQVPQGLPSLWIGHAHPPPPTFIHLLSHSFLSSFALNFHHDSGCCGESCEQEAKHPAPSSSGSDGKSTGKHAEQGQRRDPSTACLACTWDSSEPSPIPSQSPLSPLFFCHRPRRSTRQSPCHSQLNLASLSGMLERGCT